MSNIDLIAATESVAAMSTIQIIAPYVTLISTILSLCTSIVGWLRSRDERGKVRFQAATQLALPSAKKKPAKGKPTKKQPARKSRR